MENPWTHLPDSPPFVLEEDCEAVEHFNVKPDARTQIHTEILPEPFLGRPDAPVVVLSLNPGFHEYDLYWHRNNRFSKLLAAKRLNTQRKKLGRSTA